MNTYSGWDYLLIDCANHYGLDKLLFDERIKWAEQWLAAGSDLLEQQWTIADCKPLYLKAVMAIRKAQAGLPSGHMVALDAVCSGVQVMSALTGCIAGATNTGLVDPNVRADAYAKTSSVMNDILGGGFSVSREDGKRALMTSYYGSKAVPEELFGEDTPELSAFYKAMQIIAPGAWELLQDLLGAWQPWALKHCWKLPDGFDAVVKVMEKKEARIEVDELNHATFTYEFYENKGSKEGLSLVANVVHSVDAYILRCIHRRCNYDQATIKRVLHNINFQLSLNPCGEVPMYPVNEKVAYYIKQYERSSVADVVIFPYLNAGQEIFLSRKHLIALKAIAESMLVYKPFEVVSIHDSFHCHPNNINHLRQQYINIFAELAESELLSDLLSQIHGTKGTAKKLSANLGDLIRGSNYGLS